MFEKEYLNYLSEVIEMTNGNKRPRVKTPSKWKKIESSSKNNSFLSIKDLLLLNKKIWIWSDHHFNHENVIMYGKRPFSSLGDMHEKLIENYKNKTSKGDVCIFAGDVVFGSSKVFNNEILPLFNNTYNILVIGNHDFDRKILKSLDFDEIHLILNFNINDKDFIISHYPFIIENIDFINIHGHIHNKESEYPHQFNVSLENINYEPILLNEIIEKFN